MKDNTYLEESRTLLRNGRIQDCISLLRKNINDNDISNQIIQLEIRNSNLKRKINKGTIDLNDSQLEENRITNSILMIISNLAKGKKDIIGNTPKKKQFDFKWIIIGALGLAVISLGIYNFLGSGMPPPSSNLCKNITCQNGGECIDGKCNCPDGYSGKYCQTKDNHNNTATELIAKPDLKITAFQMKPEPPIQEEKVYMQAIVKNLGNGDSGNFKVKWWAGVNFPKPAFQKTFSGLGAGEEQVFNFQYDGYTSWYGTITSKLEIDVENSVKESNEKNNVFKKSYAVKKKN